MDNNWLVLIPYSRQIWLHIPSKNHTRCVYLHSKDMIVAMKEPDAEGWHNGRYAMKLSDQETKDILMEWHTNGPIEMEATEAGDQMLMRLPVNIQNEVRKAERSALFPESHLIRRHV